MKKVNRKHKDRLLRLIFADEKNKANTLSLYNALNNSSYENAEDLEITTLQDVIYINMKNDLYLAEVDEQLIISDSYSEGLRKDLRKVMMNFFLNKLPENMRKEKSWSRLPKNWRTR